MERLKRPRVTQQGNTRNGQEIWRRNQAIKSQMKLYFIAGIGFGNWLLCSWRDGNRVAREPGNFAANSNVENLNN